MGKVEVEVELDDETQSIIDERVASGEYESPSDVVEEALTLMMANSGYGSELRVSYQTLRRNLDFWLDQVEHERKTLRITRDGHVVALMKPIARTAELEARIERLERALCAAASQSTGSAPEPFQPLKTAHDK